MDGWRSRVQHAEYTPEYLRHNNLEGPRYLSYPTRERQSLQSVISICLMFGFTCSAWFRSYFGHVPSSSQREEPRSGTVGVRVLPRLHSGLASSGATAAGSSESLAGALVATSTYRVRRFPGFGGLLSSSESRSFSGREETQTPPMETGDGGRHGPRQLEIGDGDGGASPILANPGRGRGRLRGASPGPSPDKPGTGTVTGTVPDCRCCGYSTVLKSRGLLMLLKLTLDSDDGARVCCYRTLLQVGQMQSGYGPTYG